MEKERVSETDFPGFRNTKQGGTAEVKPFGPFDRSDQQGSDGFFISMKYKTTMTVWKSFLKLNNFQRNTYVVSAVFMILKKISVLTVT